MKMPLFTISSKALKKYIKYLTIFCLGFILIDQSTAWMLGINYKKIYSGPGRYNYIRENRYDCLVMGSSTSTCYYSDILSKELGVSVLNVGLDGCSLIYSRCLLEYVLIHKVKPEIILLNIDLFEFLTTAWSGNFYSRIEQLRPLYGQSSYIDSALLMGEPWAVLKYLVSSYKFNDLPLSILIKRIKSEKRYERERSPQGVLKIPIDAKTLNEKFGNKGKVDSRKMDLLREFIMVCKSNHIKLICVESPKYYPGMRISREEYDVVAQVELLSEDQEIPYLRITQEYYNEFQTNKVFKDVLHLNNKGSIIFSNILCHELIKIGL